MRRARAAALALAGLALGAAGPPAGIVEQAVFPGRVTRVAAPQTGTAIEYREVKQGKEGGRAYQLRLRYPGGRVETLQEIDRSVGVTWAANGRRLYVNDWEGSNVADCLAVTPGRPKARVRSITDALNRAHLDVLADSYEAEHLYVACARWLSPQRVAVEVWGDSFRGGPCRWFERHFSYDFGRDEARAARPGSTTACG